MRRFKKIAAVAAMFALALSTFGCGKKEEEPTSTNTETVQTGGDATDAVLDDGDWPTTEMAVIEEERFITVEGEDVIGINFDDNELHGFVTYENGGKYKLNAENGEMVADIEKTGTVEHGCQLYFDGFTMAKGCEYTLSFDVYSTVDRIVEWRVQINGGDYHAYASDKVNLTSEKQTVTQTFVMEENSDPAPRFVVNMGAFEGMGEVGAHQIHFDNISLIVSDSSNAEDIKGAPIPVPVKVNQIGYRPDDVKTVITTSDADEKFKIVDAKTDETVYVGKYNEELVYDVSVSSVVKVGDFTEVKTPGTYKVLSSPSGYSYEFSIGDGLYDDIYRDVVLMLYNQRCGCKLDGSISGDFAHEACHMEDAVVYDSTETRSVTGGWHDAGDYGRYVVPGAKTVQDLLLAYEDYNYTDDSIGIPESGNGVPDLLDEARYELEWMLKMQDESSGGVYHKVTALVFPETVLAVEETDQMVLAPISYAATADFAAVMAKASIVYQDFDADFADACLDAAVTAYGYIEANPDKKVFKNPEDIVTGEYPDAQLEDEFVWASGELYIATGDDKYKTALSTALDENFMKGLGWASIGTYAIYDLAKAEGIDESIKSKANDMVVATADKLVKTCGDSAFSIGLNSSFPWGSNMTVANDGMLLLMTANLTGDDQYLEYAQKHRDYIFGTNGTAYCYVTGYGSLSPQGTHHRPSQVLGKTMPGMLVGGPNSNLEDPYAVAVLTGLPAALAYVDNDQSFSCNEVTIYWNSPLIYLMTGLK
ncbi:MAG: glycoside hydrolase family 9 protein [Clostridium sp.]|nr:glycoside hydrolase family 9 protein [Clostridium sp.]MCM1399070.1 glycoside hydrolase family 9 protein [Clostridium sp.]MCM1459461.1 glycoside hydrolase family 9 protein [Bacteroides sp.]